MASGRTVPFRPPLTAFNVVGDRERILAALDDRDVRVEGAGELSG